LTQRLLGPFQKETEIVLENPPPCVSSGIRNESSIPPPPPQNSNTLYSLPANINNSFLPPLSTIYSFIREPNEIAPALITLKVVSKTDDDENQFTVLY
jgi:hypothetical protein